MTPRGLPPTGDVAVPVNRSHAPSGRKCAERVKHHARKHVSHRSIVRADGMKPQTGALVQFCRSNAATLRSLTHGPAQMSKGMATSSGLAAGIAPGLAGAFGGFTVFMIVLIMALIGAQD